MDGFTRIRADWHFGGPWWPLVKVPLTSDCDGVGEGGKWGRSWNDEGWSFGGAS